jgi:flagellin-like hook-associated protein FlgL
MASISRLGSNQSNLATLNEQLSSGIKSSNLSDYTATQAQNLLDLNCALTRKTAYEDNVKTIQTRISAYDNALTGIESVASQAVSLCETNVAYNSDSNGTTATSIEGFLQDIEYYLNQQVSGRYVFSGTRFDKPPVANLTELATSSPVSTATSTAVEVSPILPAYDTEYDPAAAAAGTPVADKAAYIEDTVSIDTSSKLTYGVTSDQPAFQNLILGLRFAYSATQDPTNYKDLMSEAKTLINEGLTGIQSIHAGVSSNAATLNSVAARLTNESSVIEDQISNIRSVDTNEVSVKVTSSQTQMEAAYSATAKLLTLSIVNYV